MTPTTPVFPSRRWDFVPPREVLFAKDQPQYSPLPATVDNSGRVTTRWKLTWSERLAVLLSGNLWLQQLTFNAPLQAVKLTADEPAIPEQ